MYSFVDWKLGRGLLGLELEVGEMWGSYCVLQGIKYEKLYWDNSILFPLSLEGGREDH